MDDPKKVQQNNHSNLFNNQMYLGTLIGILLSGLILLLSGHPPKSPITINPTPTQTLIKVQISGAVARPGVYEIQPGSRWVDVIDMAGGLTTDANLEKMNSAAFLFDGQSIVIPSWMDETLIPDAKNELAEENDIQYPININYCTQSDLESLPGIGEQKASAIIAYRDQNGGFATIEDIMLVPGIGETIFNAIKDQITVK